MLTCTHSEGHRPATLLAADPSSLSFLPSRVAVPVAVAGLQHKSEGKYGTYSANFYFFSGGINKSEWTDIKVRAGGTTSSSTG